MSQIFNIGDTVRIKVGARYIQPKAYIYFVEEMRKYAGEIAVIQDIRHDPSNDLYMLSDSAGNKIGIPGVNEKGYWLWDKNWLEPVGNPIEISTEDLIGAFEQ